MSKVSTKNTLLNKSDSIMVSKEKELAKAIMRGDSRIELSEDLSSGIEKIREPSQIVWGSVIAALAASSFFWAGSGLALGLMVGLPAILAISGGVGGVVFLALGAQGTVCTFKLLRAAQTTDVLTYIRDKYNLTDRILTRK